MSRNRGGEGIGGGVFEEEKTSKLEARQDTVAFVCYVISLGFPTVFLWYRGRRYGMRSNPTWRGAFWRSIAWSVPTCWAAVVIHSGH